MPRLNPSSQPRGPLIRAGWSVVLAVVLAVAGGLCAISPLQAQSRTEPTTAATYTLAFRDAPMDQALEELARRTRIDLVYSSRLVDGKRVYCSGRNQTAERLLGCVLHGSGLDYLRTSAGTYMVIEAARRPALTGHLSGRIVDASTGEPMPAANVLLADVSAGTTTDEAGLFSFGGLLTGVHRIVVTYVGYQTVLDSVRVEAGARPRVEIALFPEAVSLDPLVIDGLTQRVPSSRLGGPELTRPAWLAWTASGTPDVARGAAHLPGVAVQPPLADLHLEGAAGGEHLTLLDGVPVRDPVSLGRHLSAFSPLAIDRLTVHKAGFGVEHGSHLTGVVALDQTLSDDENRNVVVSADPVSLNARVQARFSGAAGRRGAVMVALRSSLWDLFHDPGVEDLLEHWNAVDPLITSLWVRQTVNEETIRLEEQTPDLGFSDVHAAASVPLAPFRTLHASLYRARNRIASDFMAVNAFGTDPTDRLILTSDDYDWTNWAGQATHNWLLGARSVAKIQVLGSRHTSSYIYRAARTEIAPNLDRAAVEREAAALRPAFDAGGGSDELHRIEEAALRGSLNYAASPRVHVESGFEAGAMRSRIEFANPFIAPFMHHSTAWTFAGYLRGAWTATPRTTLEPGVRLTYLPQRSTVYAEPRLALRYDRSQSWIGPYALRAAAGVYRQFVNRFELTSAGSTTLVPGLLFWLPTDRSLAPPRALHLSAESLLLPSERWTFSVGAYLKHQPRLLTLDYARLLAEYPASRPLPPAVELAPSAFISPARGRAYGLSARVQHRSPRVRGSATYALGRVERRYPGRFEGRLMPTPWNAPHRLTVDARLRVWGGLSVQSSWLSVWGRSWGLRQNYYDYLALRNQPTSVQGYDFYRPTDHALPVYARLDAGFGFEQTFSQTRVHARIAFVNVTNRRNVYDWSVARTGGGTAQIARTLPGRHPTFLLRLSY